jgi:hypothetical protein
MGLADEQVESIRERYEEAFCYINGDILLLNPSKAFCIFQELAEEGFVVASFYCGIMTCLGLGTEKDIDKGSELLKLQEMTLGYNTEVLLEQCGLFRELTVEDQLKCINYWTENHQTVHALYLKMTI